MELPQIGKHCNEENCKQIDFLPLQCSCGKFFCSEHFQMHCNSCRLFKNLTAEKLKMIEHVYICSHLGCTHRSIVPLLCDKCGKHFCVQHRHITKCEELDPAIVAAEKERYAAPVRLFNEAKAIVDKQVEDNLIKAKSKGKHQDVANKLQLMRIKNKATGQKTIPTNQRVYFNVLCSKNLKETPVFVSNAWTLGRVIDAVAQECKLLNNNHKSNEKKLRLFKKNDGTIVSKAMSTQISSLIEQKVIVDGENVIIEYVDDDCQSL